MDTINTIATTPNNTIPFIDLDKSCSVYYQNNTGFFMKDYEGIPENLLINVLAWFGLLFLFTFLRRIGDYGRFGLVKNDEERRLLAPQKSRYNIRLVTNRRFRSNPFKRWSSRFFANNDDGSSSMSENELNTSTDNVVSNENKSSDNDSNSSPSTSSQTPMRNQSTLSANKDYPHSKNYNDNYFFSWVINMHKLKDKHIKDKAGEDALCYLIFQRYLIIYLFVITCLSLSVILPVNILNGTAISDNNLFSKTTISNIDPNSSVLWLHVVLSWTFLVFGFIIVRFFSKRMAYTEGEYVSRTVLITNFPTEFCKRDFIQKHFAEAYPELVVKDIQFAYDINVLTKLNSKKHSMEIGKLTSRQIFEQSGQRPMMHPFHFGSLVELCCCCFTSCMENNNEKYTDSIEFYTRNENELKVKIAECRELALNQPLGILFVTFDTQSMAAKFLKDYHMGICRTFLKSIFGSKCSECVCCNMCKHLANKSSFSEKIKSDNWSVKYATSPSNIKWENISKYGFNWWFRVALINMVLFIMMLFFTTPSILLDKISSLGDLKDVKYIENLMPNYLVQFLPSLILRLLAALLPVLVALTALAELHWTRSAENRSMMVKTFLLLLFMVLILPTLGLTSINALFQWFKDNQNVKWRCVSDNGAFFIKYVTTCSLIGTALDLLRLPELFLYLARMLYSRSSAERQAVRMQAAFEFDYGVQYAWMLTVFTVTICFSVVCPLIAPFGLLYLVLKHLVDRYNIFFAYVPTKVDKRIHKTAVTFTIGSFIMLQFCILFFIAVRNKGNINYWSITTLQIIVITFSCLIFFGRLFFGFFKRLSPFSYSKDGLINQSPLSINNNNYEYEVGAPGNNNSPNVAEINVVIEEPQNINQSSNFPNSSSETGQEASNRLSKIFSSKNKKRKCLPEIELQSPFIPTLLRTHPFQTKLSGISEINSSLSPENQQTSSVFKINNQTESIVDENQIEINLENKNHDTVNRGAFASTQSYGAVNDSHNNSIGQVKEITDGISNEAFSEK